MITSGADFKKWADVFGITSGGGGDTGYYQPNGSSLAVAFNEGDPDLYVPLPIPSILEITNAPLDGSGSLYLPLVEAGGFEMPVKGQLSFYIFNYGSANFGVFEADNDPLGEITPGGVAQLFLVADNVLASPQWRFVTIVNGLLNGTDFADLSTLQTNLQITGLQQICFFDWYAPSVNGAQIGQTPYTNYTAQTRQFLQSVSNILYGQGALPARYHGSSPLVISIPWYITTTSTTAFTLKISAAWVPMNATMDVSLSTPTSVPVTPSGTANQRQMLTTLLTPSGTWSAYSGLVIKIERDGTDSLATTVNLLPIFLAFTSTAGNDA
jgi:hypothetical protein